MLLQNSVINKYKEIYPNHTIRDIAKLTGIQQTRVFRILNGYEMKLSEYEVLRKVISKSTHHLEVEYEIGIVGKLKNLTEEQLKAIHDDILYFITNNSIVKNYTHNTNALFKV